MILTLCCIAFTLWVIAFRYRRRQVYKLASKIPPPTKEMPVIGIAHTLIGDTEDIMNKLKDYSYAAMEHQGIVRGWLNHILYFLIVDPVDIEMVLKTCMEKDDLHRFFRNVIGNGGIFAPVSIWRRRRKILVPAFSPKIVESFVDIFAEQTEVMTNKLNEQTKKGNFSVWPFISTYTLDSVSQTAMGVKVHAQSNPKSPFLLSMTRILNLTCQRIFHLWLQPDWIYKFFPQYTEHQACLKQMHDFTDEVIRKKRDELRIESQNKSEVDIAYGLDDYKKKTFLDHLITLSSKTDKGYTDRELREEVLTLTIAGTDTSAVAICYTLKMLAKYPDVQQRVYEEIYDIFGTSDRDLVKEDLLQLKFLERVVKETLRLFPPVPFIIRKIEENVTLPSGKVLPAGSGLVISIWGIHRDPKYWGPDAEKFDPDRFSPERLNLKHVCSFMPFSQGPRNCLGYQYALMSIKTAVSSIVRKFVVVPDPQNSDEPKIRVKLDVMMKDVDGYQIALERRIPPSTTTVITN
ncbi:unnamed protein product [Diatraea saccharalis]|uniref:Cytochrome P450 n=1 Tax=Diatraea saccharalis TaxID=40085 RepID=A0A9N9QX31_9NEOP|nr:unnamed protein product [Diatraea saccharalis]